MYRDSLLNMPGNNGHPTAMTTSGLLFSWRLVPRKFISQHVWVAPKEHFHQWQPTARAQLTVKQDEQRLEKRNTVCLDEVHGHRINGKNKIISPIKSGSLKTGLLPLG